MRSVHRLIALFAVGLGAVHPMIASACDCHPGKLGPSGAPVGSPIYGVVDKFPLSPSVGLDRAKEAGFSWVRINFWWNDLEPTQQGQYNWDLVDAQVNDTYCKGFAILASIRGTPVWAARATPTRTDCGNQAYPGTDLRTLNPPTSPAYFESFMRDLTARYRGKIAAYEMWNEPDNCHFWRGSKAEYQSMILIPGTTAVKAVAPGAYVLAPALAGGGAYGDWVKNAQHGLVAPIDFISLHLYPTPSNMQAAADTLAAANGFVAASPSLRGYWLTEFGFGSSGSHGDVCDWAKGPDPAAYTEQMFNFCWNSPWCLEAFYFTLTDDGPTPTCDLGLLHNDGSIKSRFCDVEQYMQGRYTTSGCP